MYKLTLGADGMFFENDLQFLRDILKKCHIDTHIAEPSEPLCAVTGQRLSASLGAPSEHTSTEEFIGRLEPKTLYRLTADHGPAYLCILLPFSAPKVLFIGPYLPSPMSRELMLENARKHSVSQKNLKYINEYCSSLQTLLPDDHLFSVINTFCEMIWKSPSFAIVDVTGERSKPMSPTSEASGFDDTLMEMRTMEMRYDFENELMEAVSLGQIHKEPQLLAAFSGPYFEKRVADPLRNAKNYGIIMNTLLRKAAQKGGVHPMYLDSISSSFAKKIEQLGSASDSFELMCDMFRSYCRLVRKHTMKDYSPTVQKTILLIESDLSADLSLAALAQSQSISAGYLSAVFKKETGKTLSEYIREKRVEFAQHLLSTTHLQIQTVASSCGIMDVQYFSKLFKKQTGKTPKEYRESIKKQS